MFRMVVVGLCFGVALLVGTGASAGTGPVAAAEVAQASPGPVQSCPAGQICEFELPTPGSQPTKLPPGADPPGQMLRGAIMIGIMGALFVVYLRWARDRRPVA